MSAAEIEEIRSTATGRESVIIMLNHGSIMSSLFKHLNTLFDV